MNEKTTGTSAAAGTSSTPQRDEAALALKSSVASDARNLTAGAKNIAGDLADEAKTAAESGLNTGKKRAVEGLEGVAKAIRKTGEHLRAEDQGGFTQYFDKAAEQVDVASEYLQTRTLVQLIGDVEQFARREPALFLGGAFVAGLLGGRFLKSSRVQAQVSSGGGGQSTATRYDRGQEFSTEATGVRSRDGYGYGASRRESPRELGREAGTYGSTVRESSGREAGPDQTKRTGNPGDSSGGGTQRGGSTRAPSSSESATGSTGSQKAKAGGEGSPRTPGSS